MSQNGACNRGVKMWRFHAYLPVVIRLLGFWNLPPGDHVFQYGGGGQAYAFAVIPRLVFRNSCLQTQRRNVADAENIHPPSFGAWYFGFGGPAMFSLMRRLRSSMSIHDLLYTCMCRLNCAVAKSIYSPYFCPWYLGIGPWAPLSYMWR